MDRRINHNCAGCGDELSHGDRERNPRKWCSEACRLRAFRVANPDYVIRNNTQTAKRRRDAREGSTNG